MTLVIYEGSAGSGLFDRYVNLATTYGTVVRASGGYGGGFVRVGNVSLPVAAAPERYPLDWYATGVQFQVTIGGGNDPATIGVPLSLPGAPTTLDPLLPTEAGVAGGAQLSPLVLQASFVGEGGPIGPTGGSLNLHLVRPLSTSVFVIGTSLIPLLLALLLIVLLFAPRPSETPRFGLEALVGVTAVLLAVLPIRLVLVPGTVSGLTVIDYLLGVEMALLAAVACIAGAIAYLGQDSDRPEEPRQIL